MKGGEIFPGGAENDMGISVQLLVHGRRVSNGGGAPKDLTLKHELAKKQRTSSKPHEDTK